MWRLVFGKSRDLGIDQRESDTSGSDDLKQLFKKLLWTRDDLTGRKFRIPRKNRNSFIQDRFHQSE
jgi:hypothetical protein